MEIYYLQRVKGFYKSIIHQIEANERDYEKYGHPDKYQNAINDLGASIYGADHVPWHSSLPSCFKKVIEEAKSNSLIETKEKFIDYRSTVIDDGNYILSSIEAKYPDIKNKYLTEWDRLNLAEFKNLKRDDLYFIIYYRIKSFVDEFTVRFKEEKKKTSNANWHELLKPHITPEMLNKKEEEAKFLFNEWSQVECATFCYKLAKKGWLINENTATINDFAFRKYKIDVTNSTKGTSKMNRIKIKSKELNNIFGT